MKKILIVDDYEDIHDIFRILFEDDPISIKCLNDAESALKCLKEWRPNLLILDVQLGLVDGRCLCDQIKTNTSYKSLKIILISALFGEWKSVPCKADAKIDKPFDILEVRRLVFDLLNLKLETL